MELPILLVGSPFSKAPVPRLARLPAHHTGATARPGVSDAKAWLFPDMVPIAGWFIMKNPIDGQYP